MARQKKIKVVDSEVKPEVNMSDTQVLESLETEVDKVRQELEKVKTELEEKKKEVRVIQGRDVSEDEMLIVKKQVNISVEKKELKDKIEKQKAFDSVMVTGKFINRRAPGQSAKLTYLKYETDPVKWWVLEDGKVYTIPRGFADQLNDHYYTPHFVQSTQALDPNRPASAIHDVDTSNKKYSFVPINF